MKNLKVNLDDRRSKVLDQPVLCMYRHAWKIVELLVQREERNEKCKKNRRIARLKENVEKIYQIKK